VDQKQPSRSKKRGSTLRSRRDYTGPHILNPHEDGKVPEKILLSGIGGGVEIYFQGVPHQTELDTEVVGDLGVNCKAEGLMEG